MHLVCVGVWGRRGEGDRGGGDAFNDRLTELEVCMRVSD